MSDVFICAFCWHDMRQHADKCTGPICPCDKTADTAVILRVPAGATVVGQRATA